MTCSKLLLSLTLFAIWVFTGFYGIKSTYQLLQTSIFVQKYIMHWFKDRVVFENIPICCHNFGTKFEYFLSMMNYNCHKLCQSNYFYGYKISNNQIYGRKPK